MKKNSALAGFCERFQEILDALDEFDMDETLEELNAQFEEYRQLAGERADLSQKVIELEMAVQMAARNLP